MADILSIPTDELIQELRATDNDIVACETGLTIGVTEYHDGESVQSVQQRLDTNRQVKQIIETELQRRQDDSLRKD